MLCLLRFITSSKQNISTFINPHLIEMFIINNFKDRKTITYLFKERPESLSPESLRPESLRPESLRPESLKT